MREPPLRELPIDLADVVMGMTDDPDVGAWYLNAETGETYLVLGQELELMDALQQDTELDAADDPPTEQLRQIAAGDERWREIPHEDGRDGYRRMERFLETVTDEDLSRRLDVALDGRGAFGRFRRVLEEAGRLQEWYDFKDADEEREARLWLQAIGIRPVPRPRPVP